MNARFVQVWIHFASAILSLGRLSVLPYFLNVSNIRSYMYSFYIKKYKIQSYGDKIYVKVLFIQMKVNDSKYHI